VTPEVDSASLSRTKMQMATCSTSWKPILTVPVALSWNRKRRDSKGLPGSENVACTERSVVELGRPLRVPYLSYRYGSACTTTKKACRQLMGSRTYSYYSEVGRAGYMGKGYAPTRSMHRKESSASVFQVYSKEGNIAGVV